jgi:hypothetical protein
MKKTYMIPQMLIVRVAQTLPLMGSGDLQLVGDNYTGELGTSEATSAGLSKSYSVWGDDWSAE